MPRNLLFLLGLCLFTSHITLSQIVFRELPKYELKTGDSLFFDINSRRSIVSLNGQWSVYAPGDENKKAVNVPSIFQGEGELIFEKIFNLSRRQISDHRMKIHFLGLNYSADISVNNVIIYRHLGGEFPFIIDLPKDILRDDKANVLSVKLSYSPDSETTIPLKQRFLFPKNFGGIMRDVYIHILPNVFVTEFDVGSKYQSGNNLTLNLSAKIENRDLGEADSIKHDFNIRVRLSSSAGSRDISNYSFALPKNKDKSVNLNAEVTAPMLWDPQNPNYYQIIVELWENEQLLDVTRRTLPVYSLVPSASSLYLNGISFKLTGVTFAPSNYDYGNLTSYERMESDIRFIKETGFNCVRFINSVPHPYYLRLCEEYGLFAFIELPINSPPESLTAEQDFIDRSRHYLAGFIKGFKQYSVAGLGLGSGYLGNINEHIHFINNLEQSARKLYKGLLFASFSTDSPSLKANLDLIGLDIFNMPVESLQQYLSGFRSLYGDGKLFISSATYPVYAGHTNGYSNDHSFEAQAKYFDDLIDYVYSDSISGVFLNSIFDYRGDFTSMTSGYSPENLYKIGIVGEDRNKERITHNVLQAKLHNSEKVTIPIGTKQDDAPMVFIFFGLVLAVLIGVLVNSGRKFREDASRALLRPYNFYADIRDQRIMSGYHTIILAIIVSAVSALLLSNLLYYFRANIVFERLLLSFGSTKLIYLVSYLAWHPVLSLVWLTAASFAAIILLVIIVKIASFFVRNRVFLSSVFFSVVWSFLPLILLIPVGIILYRILHTDVTNLYVFLGLLLFTLWIFYRLIKGIYVIYDVNAGSVYFYSIIFMLAVFGGILVYFEIKNSVIGYLQLTIKQYNIFG